MFGSGKNVRQHAPQKKTGRLMGNIMLLECELTKGESSNFPHKKVHPLIISTSTKIHNLPRYPDSSWAIRGTTIMALPFSVTKGCGPGRRWWRWLWTFRGNRFLTGVGLVFRFDGAKERKEKNTKGYHRLFNLVQKFAFFCLVVNDSKYEYYK